MCAVGMYGRSCCGGVLYVKAHRPLLVTAIIVEPERRIEKIAASGIAHSRCHEDWFVSQNRTFETPWARLSVFWVVVAPMTRNVPSSERVVTRNSFARSSAV